MTKVQDTTEAQALQGIGPKHQPVERFAAYKLGYIQGVRRGWGEQPPNQLHSVWWQGFKDGVKDRGKRLRAAMVKYNYKPQILREAVEGD